MGDKNHSRKKPKEWTGLKSSNFTQYRKYVNKVKPGICGSYASAALIHFTIQMDRQFDLDVEGLIKVFKGRIENQHFHPGTYPWDLTNGLNDLLAEDQTYKAHWHVVSDPVVVRELSKPNPMPVIVGTTKLFGSRYGNHWVLVYAFGYNQDGKLFYKGYDNHGRIAAVVAASQTASAVWLNKVG